MRKEDREQRPDHSRTSPEARAAAGMDLRALLRPTEVFSSPQEVLDNPLLDVTDKRAILASWASDLYAVESTPGLRQLPGCHAVVAVRDILDALKRLDAEDSLPKPPRGLFGLPIGRFAGSASARRAPRQASREKIDAQPLKCGTGQPNHQPPAL